MKFAVGSFMVKDPSGDPTMDDYHERPDEGSFTLVTAATVPYGGAASGSITGTPPPPPEPPRAVVSAVKSQQLSWGETGEAVWTSYPENVLVSEVQIIAHEVDQIVETTLVDPIGTPPPF